MVLSPYDIGRLGIPPRELLIDFSAIDSRCLVFSRFCRVNRLNFQSGIVYIFSQLRLTREFYSMTWLETFSNDLPVLSALALLLIILLTIIVILNNRLRQVRAALKQANHPFEMAVDHRGREVYSILANTEGIGLLTTDLGGAETKILSFNSGAERVFGYNADEVIGQNVSIFHHPDEVERFSEVQDSMRMGHYGFSGETTLYRKSGEPFRALLTTHPRRDKTGEVVGTLGVTVDISQRREAEAELAASRDKFEAISDQAGEGITIADTDGNYTYVNRSFCEMIGYSRDELLQMTVFEVKAKDQDNSSFERSKTTREGRPFQVMLQRKDGSEFVAEILGKIITVNDVECVMGIVRDITDRIRTEAQVLESEEKFRTLVTHSEEIVFIIDADGTFQLSEGQGLAHLSLKPGEVVGKSVYDLFNDNPKMLAKMQRAFAGETVTSEDVVAGIHFSSWYTPRRDADNQVIGLMGLSVNTTELKQAEAALQESQALLLEAQAAAKLGRYLYNIETEVWENSSELDKIFGIDDAYTRNYAGWVNIVHPDSRDAMLEYLQNDILTHHRTFDREYSIVDQTSGQQKWVHGFGRLRFNDEGKPTALFGIIQDITDKVRLEEQIRQGQRMDSIGRLAGGVAHDFNNMLNVILGHAEIALEQLEPDQVIYEDLQEIRLTAERSADLTRQLLAFARKQTISPQVLDLNDTLAGMFNMIRRLIGEEIDLHWEPGSDLWPVMFDPTQLDQILVNLCINSRDAISGVGQITIETTNTTLDKEFSAHHLGFTPGQYVLLTISDNGCGMEVGVLDKIYEPFFTTKELGAGTGLGLATVYGIIKQNHGSIDVYSEPGQGTVFKIYLPRQVGVSPIRRPERQIQSAARGTETVLLVEDEASILKLTTRILERKGYTVLPAHSPGDAIGLAREYAADIALLCTDVVLPDMSGLDLAVAVQEICPRVKCLYMSGYTANMMTKNGVLSEDTNFIAKPFTMEGLAAKVRNTLDKPGP